MAFVKGHWQLLVLVAIIFALWSTPVMVPLKIVVVLLHELSHGLAAILTGGSIEQITISPEQGGLAQLRGGSRFWSLTAGYLGSLLLGMALLFAALRSTADRVVVAGLGLLLLVVAALYLRDLFALLFCIGLAVVLLAVARWLDHRANDLVLRVIGLTSMIYVPFDIFSDTIARSHLLSDARMMANEFGGATVLWGGLWLVVSVVAIGTSLRYGLGASSNIVLGSTSRES
ncbi:peptidase M50B-like protein [Litoreibacter halocynthiae]|uniref:Peptidase M50B-like protein n=1 Tax=Litoreibacter halocynthiae TaxID=1242689 RepID=A0A4R7LM81_9RHOB|nr:M50 family metallopeptidase [Litoreibacter halocynthiae]TDT75240.1 peptidase M50B-like protein [Litoreibacter halocynthiae]